MKGTGIWHRVLAALVVATGTGIVWGLLAVWAGMLTETFWQGGDRVFERIYVMRDGTPVIQSYSSANYELVSYRTLDGQQLSIDREDWLTWASLHERQRPPGLFYWPVSWQRRIIAASDMQRPSTGWYLVRDDQPQGHAYFAGYDDYSKLPAGFIGRQGFRSAIPPREQWFDVGDNQLSWSRGVVCSTSYLNYGGRAYTYRTAGDEERLPEWLLFLIDGDRLQEVDLRSRSVRTLLEMPEMISVGILAEIQSEPSAEEPPRDDSAAARKPATPARAAAYTMQGTTRTIVVPNAFFVPTGEPSSKKVKTQNRLALRTSDRIVILDPPTGATQEFPLPEEWRDKSLDVYGLSNQELLLIHQDWGPRYDVDLLWIGADGQIIRERTETLAGYGDQNERVAAMLVTLVVPVPAGWYAVASTVMPLGLVQENKEPTYAAGLGHSFDIVWLALVIVTLFGCVFAWLVWKWQRKYHRPHTAVWCTFVFLTGLPGLMAYWLEQHRAKLETCSHCGTTVPRDRDACAACAAPFRAPQLVGTEIFA